LSPNATAEDIRRAHRTLTKLMHPDAQTDESVRRLAEMQMRRLNLIVDTLTDEEKRKHYDREIKQPALERPSTANYAATMQGGEGTSGPLIAIHKIWKAVPWWVWSTAGALILTSAAVYFWADNLGSSFNNRTMAYVPSSDGQAVSKAPPREPRRDTSQTTDSPQTTDSSQKSDGTSSNNKLDDLSKRQPVVTQQSEDGKETAKELPATQAAQTSSSQSPEGQKQTSRTRTAAPPARSSPSKRVAVPGAPTAPSRQAEEARLPSMPIEAALQTPPPVVLATPPLSDSQEPEASSPGPTSFALEGDWVYEPEKPELRKAGLFPPTFIELKIYRTSGEWRGVYHARYRVEDRPVDPDVNFLLSGTDLEAKKFRWESPNGSKGTLRIKRLTDSTIKVEWNTMVYSTQHVLTSGIATLSKR
jgi:curved DNA-binding protein CbpA